MLVLGATGNAGRMAVEIARHLGAGQVIGAARSAEKLANLDVDLTVTLDDLGPAADVDIVLDYLWGAPDAGRHPRHRHPAAGSRPPARLDPDRLRRGTGHRPALRRPARRQPPPHGQRPGLGQHAQAIVAELPALAAAIGAGAFTVDAQPLALSEVETAWHAPTTRRIVFTPAG